MKKLLLFAVISILVVSCGPSINPVFQKRINDLYGKHSSQSYSGTAKFVKPMPWAEGQWVIYGTTNNNKKTISKISILGQEQGGWILENYSLTETEETVMQMCISGMDKMTSSRNPDDIDIIWIKIRDKDGKVSKLEGMMLSFTKGMYKKMLPSMNIDVSGEDGGTITVPGGTFNNTLKFRTEVSFWGSKHTSDTWCHESVPINGLVKSISSEDNLVMELLDFGMTGATSNL
jgi:hypothetical protein